MGFPKAFNKMIRDVLLPKKKQIKHLNIAENKLNHVTAG